MPQYTKSIVLDVNAVNKHQYIDAKQLDDNSRFLKVTLLANGKPVAIETGTTAMFRAVKPDKRSVCYEAQINSDGTVTVELTQQALACKGVAEADVSLVGSDGTVLSTASFFLQVQGAPLGNDIASESEILIFQQLADEAAASAAQSIAAATSVGEDAEAAEEAASAAQTAKNAAETAKNTTVQIAESLQATVEAAEEATETANGAASEATEKAQQASNAASAANSAASGANTAKTNADAATASANAAAAAANAAASAVGEEIDGIVFKDTTNNVDYLAKFRLVDGMPVIEYSEI